MAEKDTQLGLDKTLAADLKDRMCRLVDVLVDTDGSDAKQAFESLLSRAGNLWRRKEAMEGTKSETRDLLGELLFSRLRTAFRTFHEDSGPGQEIKAAEWVLGMLFSGAALHDFATALDRTMIGSQGKRDFSFAGQTNFISIQEVMQLLSGGGYSGMLAIERDDNRVDLFFRDGKVLLLDPHHLARRVMPGHDNFQYREVPSDLIQQAEGIKSTSDIPLVIALRKLGFLKESELGDLLQNLGLEVFYEFLFDAHNCTFFYKKLDAMPEFVDKYGYAMPVTPILLEGSKRCDEWQMFLEVFPDPDQPLEAVSDMFARIDGMNLGVLEIKLLATVNRGSSARDVARSIGLPLFEVYEHIVRFARDGIIVPTGRSERLSQLAFTVEETMEKAFEMLDANDDDLSKERALEDALGDPFSDFGGDFGGGDESETFLDILSAKDPRA